MNGCYSGRMILELVRPFVIFVVFISMQNELSQQGKLISWRSLTCDRVACLEWTFVFLHVYQFINNKRLFQTTRLRLVVQQALDWLWTVKSRRFVKWAFDDPAAEQLVSLAWSEIKTLNCGSVSGSPSCSLTCEIWKSAKETSLNFHFMNWCLINTY